MQIHCQSCKTLFMFFGITLVSVIFAVFLVPHNASLNNHKLEEQLKLIVGQAEIPEVDAAVHLGGFCFGHSHEPDVVVGRFTVTIHVDEFEPGQNNTSQEAWVVWYDDRDDHWGEVRSKWSESTCEEKLSRATGMQSFVWRDPVTVVIEGVKQWTMSRHWHMTILSCTSPRKIALSYWLSAEKELSRWGPGELNPPPCPDDWTVQQHLEELQDEAIKFLVA